ncbi:hypothetical protein TNCV_3841861 [Trichonephila clavipes]|nr:hypothetical protein TNCV_3841861 [Trichonephila clavipes]
MEFHWMESRSILMTAPYPSTVGPSYVGQPGNGVVDDLVKAATSDPVDPEDHMVVTSSEIYSRAKELLCRTCVVPPVHSCLHVCFTERLKLFPQTLVKTGKKTGNTGGEGRVYSGGIRTLSDLKASIVRSVAEILRELLHATTENARMRFQHVIDVNGAHIEHIVGLIIRLRSSIRDANLIQ